ncbi:MAG: hypothetical protein LBI02_07430, partial [Opitutaceae bacterium]|nr:hypothetical protein [Opitutaceae bacterium]
DAKRANEVCCDTEDTESAGGKYLFRRGLCGIRGSRFVFSASQRAFPIFLFDGCFQYPLFLSISWVFKG